MNKAKSKSKSKKSRKRTSIIKLRIPVTMEDKNPSNALQAVNLFFFNDINSNKLVDGEYVKKYPEILAANPVIKEMHYLIHRGKTFDVFLEYFSDGSYKISLPPESKKIVKIIFPKFS